MLRLRVVPTNPCNLLGVDESEGYRKVEVRERAFVHFSSCYRQCDLTHSDVNRFLIC